jgi:hypothetical protein
LPDEKQVNRARSIVAVLALCCWSQPAGAQKQGLTIDATKELAAPARGRGPFPRSIIPEYVPSLPLKVELSIPDGKIDADGNVLIDFVITNVGRDAIQLPSSVHQPPSMLGSGITDVLTLFSTADDDAIGVFELGKKPNVASNGLMGSYGTSAELYGRSDDPQSYYVLAPHSRILVHTSSRMPLRPGLHRFVAHAELARVSGGASSTSQLSGIVDSVAVKKRLQVR